MSLRTGPLIRCGNDMDFSFSGGLHIPLRGNGALDFSVLLLKFPNALANQHQHLRIHRPPPHTLRCIRSFAAFLLQCEGKHFLLPEIPRQSRKSNSSFGVISKTSHSIQAKNRERKRGTGRIQSPQVCSAESYRYSHLYYTMDHRKMQEKHLHLRYIFSAQ